MSVDNNKIEIHKSWLNVLKKEFSQNYMEDIKKYLQYQFKNGIQIYPPYNLIFNAFNLTPLNLVKVVILGQDPYHGANQAHGLSFSVPTDIELPSSLKNIYKELQDDLGISLDSNNGNLERWASQGVMLLNTSLTVEQNKPLSHKKLGWEKFTNKVISLISKERNNIVFILWGSHAKSKSKFISPEKHLILQSSHPSPLSSYRGFFGSRPFSKTNKYLSKNNIDTINWA